MLLGWVGASVQGNKEYSREIDNGVYFYSHYRLEPKKVVKRCIEYVVAIGPQLPLNKQIPGQSIKSIKLEYVKVGNMSNIGVWSVLGFT